MCDQIIWKNTQGVLLEKEQLKHYESLQTEKQRQAYIDLILHKKNEEWGTPDESPINKAILESKKTIDIYFLGDTEIEGC